MAVSLGAREIDLDTSGPDLVTRIVHPGGGILFARRGFDRHGDGRESILISHAGSYHEVDGQSEPPALMTLGAGFGNGGMGGLMMAANYFKNDGFAEVFGSDSNTCSSFVLFGPNHLNAIGQISQDSNSPGFRFCGPATFQTSLGDVSGDGIEDVAVRIQASVAVSFGRDRWTGGLYTVQGLLVAGTPSGGAFGTGLAGEGFRAGDTNGDGSNDFLIRAGDPNTLWMYRGPFPVGTQYYYPDDFVGSRFTRFRYLPVGAPEQNPGTPRGDFDFNGDGIADVLFGMPSNSLPGLENSGVACVVFGFAGAWPSEINIAEPPTKGAFCLRGEISGRSLGLSATALGDLDGDGFDEFAVRVENPTEIIVVRGRAQPGELLLSEMSPDDGRVLQTSLQLDHIERIDRFDGNEYAELMIGGLGTVLLVRGSPAYFGRDELLVDGFEQIAR